MAVRTGRLVGSVLVLLLGGCAGQQDAVGSLPAGSPEPEIANQWQTEGCRTPRRPELVETAGSITAQPPKDLREAIARIQQAGSKQFVESYTGVEVVPERVQAIVYRLPSAALDDFIRQAAGDTCIVVRDAAYSAVELTRLAERISLDIDYWRERGVRINAVAPRHDGSGVQVSTQDAAVAKVELPKRYGDQPPIFVEEGSPVVPL